MNCYGNSKQLLPPSCLNNSKFHDAIVNLVKLEIPRRKFTSSRYALLNRARVHRLLLPRPPRESGKSRCLRRRTDTKEPRFPGNDSLDRSPPNVKNRRISCYQRSYNYRVDVPEARVVSISRHFRRRNSARWFYLFFIYFYSE